jgi:GntR family transcriptional regulator, transcriptional repressor for pyruvate dehydrogenase complex
MTPRKPAAAVAAEADPGERLPQRRLRPTKLPYQVASAVVEEIVGLDLAAGEPLPTEAELAERFGVSRVSIREALRVLETFGVVRIKPGKNGGNEVGAIDAEALARTLALFFRMARATYRDLMDARLVIEPFMASRAAARRDAEQLEELRGLMEREAASTAGTREGDRLALAFHELICGASGNPVMDGLGRAIHALYGDRLAANLLYDPGCWTTARQIHQEIGRAVLAGDGRRAYELMAEHMDDFRTLQEERTPWLLDELVAWAP